MSLSCDWVSSFLVFLFWIVLSVGRKGAYPFWYSKSCAHCYAKVFKMPWTITLASLKGLNPLLRLHVCFKVLLTGWSILTDTTKNSFQSFGHGKHANILVISASVSSHQLQGVIKHLQNAACHSEQISKIRQSFFTFIDTKVLLHTENLAFVTVKKKNKTKTIELLEQLIPGRPCDHIPWQVW